MNNSLKYKLFFVSILMLVGVFLSACRQSQTISDTELKVLKEFSDCEAVSINQLKTGVLVVPGIVVTKLNDDQTRLLLEAGCIDLGENRPQQLWRKVDELQDETVRWHLIGHLHYHLGQVSYHRRLLDG